MGCCCLDSWNGSIQFQMFIVLMPTIWYNDICKKQMTSTYSHSQIHLVAQCTFPQSTLKMNVIPSNDAVYVIRFSRVTSHLMCPQVKKLTKVPSGLETATRQGWWIAALKHFWNSSGQSGKWMPFFRLASQVKDLHPGKEFGSWLRLSHGMAESHQVCCILNRVCFNVCLDCAGYKVELGMPQCLLYFIGEVSGSSGNIRDCLLPRRLNSPHRWKKLRSPWCRPSLNLRQVMAGHSEKTIHGWSTTLVTASSFNCILDRHIVAYHDI